MNRLEVSGGLVRDPEVEPMGAQHKVTMQVAVGVPRYDPNAGTETVKTVFVTCEAYAQAAAELVGYDLHKGDKVYLLGELDQVRKSADDDKPSTRLRVMQFTVLWKKVDP